MHKLGHWPCGTGPRRGCLDAKYPADCSAPSDAFGKLSCLKGENPVTRRGLAILGGMWLRFWYRERHWAGGSHGSLWCQRGSALSLSSQLAGWQLGDSGGQWPPLVTVPSAHRALPRPAVFLPACSMSPRPAASSAPDLRRLERTSWASASNPTAPSLARPRAPAQPVTAPVRMGTGLSRGPGASQAGEGWREAGRSQTATGWSVRGVGAKGERSDHRAGWGVPGPALPQPRGGS